MAFNNIGHQLQYIASNGDYTDLMNVMVLINSFSRVYTTGQVPTVRKLRGGKQASSIANLEAILTGATSDTNSIHDYNKVRDEFYAYIAAVQPGVFDEINVGLYSRLGVQATPGFPLDIEDCEGTILGTATTLQEYLDLWNDTKVDADNAICGTRTNYLFDTGVSGYLGESAIQPDNSKIILNAPSVQNHSQRLEVNSNREDIVDKEAQVKPKSISTYSNNNT